MRPLGPAPPQNIPVILKQIDALVSIDQDIATATRERAKRVVSSAYQMGMAGKLKLLYPRVSVTPEGRITLLYCSKQSPLRTVSVVVYDGEGDSRYGLIARLKGKNHLFGFYEELRVVSTIVWAMQGGSAS